MGSVMSLPCSKRKATTQDVESSSKESCKRQKISSTNDDDEYCRLISDESSWKHPWSLCANRVVNVTAAVGFLTRFTQFRLKDDKDTGSSILSPPTSLAHNWKYTVFPSFHGADVRKTILSHILASFRRKGIYPFIDNDIDRSKSIGPELKKAIRDSKIAIVLLSKNYASSSWCLNELVKIIKCRGVLGQKVMTIFYEVDPSDIKKQAGDFGKAFRKTCKGKTKKNIEKWRNALESVATIAGEHSCKWVNEAAMIEKITTDVSNMLANATPYRDFDDYVGMRAHMANMESLLCLESDEVRMVGIWGPPGIGKSTIARVVFNQFSRRFQLGTIMVNIKECYPKPCLDEYNVQLKLQNQMLSRITNQKDMKICHLGVAQELLKDKKVLLIIDEADRLGQLDALAKEISWFGFGSRIIVTTEDRSLLNAHGIKHVYKVKFPSSDEAFQIFCMYAFRQKRPDEGFYELAKEVSYLAGELPLGLKVLGSALRGKSKQEWEMILPRLKTSLHGETKSIIKFSYNALYDEEKYLLLYIACFFNYTSTLPVEELLAKQFSNVREGLHILAEKSLISIKYGFIEMHKLVEQFGRETSRKQFVHDGLAKRQLLVNERDIFEVLTGNKIDSNHFVGINVNLNLSKWIEEDINISDEALKRMADLQFIKVQSYPGKIFQWESVVQNLIFHSQKIRSLSWTYFGNICLPDTFNTKFLVKLDLSYSKLQTLWEGNKELKNLKWMILTCSEYLKELPDLSTATKLEKLILGGCSRLVEVPDLSNAIKLRYLSLQGCSSLVTLSSIGSLNNLDTIDLYDCSSLVELPFSIGTAINLKDLNLSRCSSLVKLPSSVGNLINLEVINVCDCSSLVEIPSSIGNLPKWQRLIMNECSKLEAFPTNINLESLVLSELRDGSQLKSFPGIFTNIKQLYLAGTAINKIPLTIKLWPFLSALNLNDCNNLVSLPQFPDSLTYLDASNCKSLERLDCSFNNPEIVLVFRDGFKLNQEARDLIINTSYRYAVLPGTEMPACFNLRGTSGGLLTSKLNESTHPNSLSFKACILLVEGEGNDDTSTIVQFETMIKGNDIIIQSSFNYLGEPSREHLYIFDVAIEVGGEVDTSTELFVKFNINSRKWRIGEWGIMQI